MQNLWNDEEASQFEDELGLRVYSSRLLGREKTLVLHGGGNTSVKLTGTSILGEEEVLLYVKGSGWDLETIDRPGFSPVRLEYLLRLAQLESLSDPQMVNELKTHMTVATAPTPSVEAILHATLPYKYVDHTHADAVVTITNTANGLERIRALYGDSVVIVPYIMPGFDLARLCAAEFQQQHHSGTVGMVLMNHGVFSFAETARESYERMIDLVSRAENYLRQEGAWDLPETAGGYSAEPDLRLPLATLRKTISEIGGDAVLLASYQDDEALAFANRGDIARISQQGPATPDHVIRTKQLPMVGRDVAAYVESYKNYFNTHAATAREARTMLDPAPRVVLDPQLGLCAIGHTAKDAGVVHDIYRHTLRIIQRAEKLGGYQALPARDIFDMEYWDLEQAKLQTAGVAPVFKGEIALVTGAASGIGRACVLSLLERGAAVVGVDIDEAVRTTHTSAAYAGYVCDVTDSAGLDAVLEKAVRRFGGLDMLVINAGVFPGGRFVAEFDIAEWQRVLDINLTSAMALLKFCYPLLQLAPNKGRVAIVGSKNVAAPGPGASAYSASKAALNQIMRVAALEWGADGIRINAVHPDAVFDTGIWTDDVIAARARHYGLTVEQYKTRNVLKTEISSRDVAELVAELLGPRFAKTTAAQIPVDGGDVRVI